MDVDVVWVSSGEDSDNCSILVRADEESDSCSILVRATSRWRLSLKGTWWTLCTWVFRFPF